MRRPAAARRANVPARRQSRRPASRTARRTRAVGGGHAEASPERTGERRAPIRIVKLAVVVQRYGADINGGAELHARYIAERLARHADGRGRHHLRARLRDVEERAAGRRRAGQRRPGAPVPRRARTRSARVRPALGRASSTSAHSVADELAWLDSEGPGEPGAGRLRRAGAPATSTSSSSSAIATTTPGTGRGGFAQKAIARADGRTRSGDRAGDLRPGVPRRARAHVQLARRAGDDPRGREQRRTCPGVVVGVGSDVPARTDAERFRQKFDIRRPFAIYIGRIDENKGCDELFSFFQRYARDVSARPRPGARSAARSSPSRSIRASIISASSTIEDKFDALAAVGPADHAVVLREPVDGRARGVGARPAGARQRALRRARRASASAATPGCTTSATRSSSRRCTRSSRTVRCNARLGRNGRDFFERHYAWPVIERKYLDMFDRLKRRSGGRHARSSRCPAGSRGAARRCRRPPRCSRGFRPVRSSAASVSPTCSQSA